MGIASLMREHHFEILFGERLYRDEYLTGRMDVKQWLTMISKIMENNGIPKSEL